MTGTPLYRLLTGRRCLSCGDIVATDSSFGAATTCALHAAASEMLDALKAAEKQLSRHVRRGYTNSDTYVVRERLRALIREVESAERTSLQKASEAQ